MLEELTMLSAGWASRRSPTISEGGVKQPRMMQVDWRTVACDEFMGCRDRKGYGRIKREGHVWQAHRWAWTQTFGPIPDGCLVCHHCDNPPCREPLHLSLGSKRDNALDMASKGRAAVQRHGWERVFGRRKKADLAGERNGNARLTLETVEDIRTRARTGQSNLEIAVALGLDRRHVWRIVRGDRWAP